MVHQAAVDERINAAWPAYEAALKAAGVKYAVHPYPGTQHGFNNDTTPRYDAAAAKLTWERTVAFFKANLQASPATASSPNTSPIVRLRGTLQSVAPDSVMLKTRSGEVIALALPASLVVMEVYECSPCTPITNGFLPDFSNKMWLKPNSYGRNMLYFQ